MAVLEFIRRRFNNHTYRQMFDSLSEAQSLGVRNADEALGAIDNFMQKVKNNDLRELAVLSPDGMRDMVGLMTKIREQTISVSKRLVRPKVSVRVDAAVIADSTATEYIMAIATAAVRADQLTADAVTTARMVLDSVDLGNL